jgi:hypothetical protein
VTDEQRHAIALTRPSSSFVREHYAAVVVQTAFQGYLVRRTPAMAAPHLPQ